MRKAIQFREGHGVGFELYSSYTSGCSASNKLFNCQASVSCVKWGDLRIKDVYEMFIRY